MSQAKLNESASNLRSAREAGDFWGVWRAYLELPIEQRHEYADFAGVYGEVQPNLWPACDRVAEAALAALAPQWRTERSDLVSELVRRATGLWIEGARALISDLLRRTLVSEAWTLDEIEWHEGHQLAVASVPRPERVDYRARPPHAPWQARAWTEQWDGGWGLTLRPMEDEGALNTPVFLADEYGRQVVALPYSFDDSKALVWSRYTQYAQKVAEVVSEDGQLVATVSRGAWVWEGWEPDAHLPLLKLGKSHSTLVLSYGGAPRWSSDALVIDYTTVVSSSTRFRSRDSGREAEEARRDMLGSLFEGRAQMDWYTGNRLHALSLPATSWEGSQEHLERVLRLLKEAQDQLLADW